MEAEWISELVKIVGPLAFANPHTTVPLLVTITVLVFFKTCGKKDK